MRVYFSEQTKGFYPEDWRLDGSYSDHLWPASVVLLTDEERSEFWKANPPDGKALGTAEGRPIWIRLPDLTTEQMAASERAWRDTTLDELIGIRDRHRDQLEIGAETTLSGQQFTELLIYMQALRDWPQSDSFPNAEYRPTQPSWILEITQGASGI